jgi:hypothetical protein
MLESIQKQWPKCAAAEEIPLRIAQCRREDATAKMEAAARVVMYPGDKPEAVQPAKATMAECAKGLTEIAGFFLAEAGKLADKPEKLETRVRMHYEAAWCYRDIARVEVETVRDRLADEALA